MSPILMPSALKAPSRTPPADSALPNDATAADTSPALMLISPPKAADSAPSGPAATAATAVSTTVAMSCHRKTVRIGLPRKRSMAFVFPAPGKACGV